jgi:hypothetical protein
MRRRVSEGLRGVETAPGVYFGDNLKPVHGGFHAC